MKKLAIHYGDTIQLGDHVLLNGDSRDRELMASRLRGRSISLIVTDPPYGVSYVEGKSAFTKSIGRHKPIENDHLQTDDEYRTFTRAWLEAARPFLARKNSAYIFGSDKMLFALRDGLVDAGWKFGQLLIWVKTQAVVGRLDYLPQHELIAYCWHGAHEFMKSKDKSVIVHPKPARSTAHSTMKPVPVIRRLILNSSRTGDTVYDPFLGSGTTLLACEQTKRHCIGVEIDPEYCRIAADRFTKLTGIEPVCIPSITAA
jgi:DNA modification methylase